MKEINMVIARSVLLISTALLSCSATAQLNVPSVKAPVHRTVVDPRMVIADRNVQLEVFPALRASAHQQGQRIAGHSVFRSAVTAPMGRSQLGVVYNHKLQVWGVTTGEISFKLRGASAPRGFDAASYPGLKLITNPGVYEVVARSPQELMVLHARLTARPDVEWVQTYVTYGGVLNTP